MQGALRQSAGFEIHVLVPGAASRALEPEACVPRSARHRGSERLTTAGWTRLPAILQPGDKAPDFALPDQNGKRMKLSDLRGQTVILYFYPRADTPGCTTQACGVRDRDDEYAKLGAKVIGVSPDEPAAIKKFDDKYGLGFTLVGDVDHRVAEKYGAWGEKSMYGKKYMGMLRSTFIIDPKGKIARVFPKVQPKKHDDLVLKALAELDAP